MTAGFLDVNGARLWYEEAGSGPALVMLHGHLIDSGQWDSQIAAFAPEFRVVRYDARGFGRSDKPVESFAFFEDLRTLLRLLEIERACLMGCSGGGATIIDLALAHPEMVGALVLVDSGLFRHPFAEQPPPKLVELRAAWERGDLDRAVELALQIWTDGERRRPEQVEAQARERTREMMARQFGRPPVTAEARTLDPPAITRLEEIRAPALVILGGEDFAPAHDIAEALATRIPGARKVIIPDAGHHPNLEHPELFNETVLEFLRAVEAG